MRLSEKKLVTTHRVCVFGSPKSGKTQLVGELSAYFNLLFFDLENGYATLLKLPKDQQERINIISIPDTKVFPIAIETMLKVITGLPFNICQTHGKVSCLLCKKESAPEDRVALNELDDSWIVVIDSLTQLSNSAMNHLTKNQDDLYKPEWSDYRNQGQLLDKLLSQVQQAKFNIVCITHETETEMEDGRKKLVPVAGTTSFSRNTAKYFDDVVYCEVKNRKHAFASATTYAGNILTGSRTGTVLEADEKPTLLRIFAAERTGTQTAPATQHVQDAGRASSLLEKLKSKSAS